MMMKMNNACCISGNVSGKSVSRMNCPHRTCEFVGLCDGEILPVSNFAGFT
ncbi:hypothetical protein A2U01_0021030 [Trifolium medium]|uniref:Uncharacterized protein n=1 Tax=Trifolium medium TaxID=97028 RepID=A0A392NLN9_9FABA|nr:hypothetical protein [Trifolium medium]